MVFFVCACLAVHLSVAPAFAESPATPPPPLDKKAADLDAQRLNYQGVQDTLAQAEEQRKKIEAEIASFQNDRAALNKALLDARQKIDNSENKAAEAQNRLETLTGSEAAIRRSLESRRGVLVEVLAALQRMGREPPPAMLAEPQDVLRAIRASMMLGAVLPQLRAETEALANDLHDLVSLRASIAVERASLDGELETRRHERARLEALIAERQKSIGEAQDALAAERARSQALASQAANLKDLLARMENELESARKSADLARKAEEERAKLSAEAAAEAKARSPARRCAIRRASPPPSPSTTPGHAGAAGQRQGHQIFRRAGRFWRRRERTFSRDAAQGHCFVAKRWLYRFLGTVAELWTALDRQRRRRLLCRFGGDGSNRRGCRTIRHCWRTGRRPWATERRKRRRLSRLARRSLSSM